MFFLRTYVSRLKGYFENYVIRFRSNIFLGILHPAAEQRENLKRKILSVGFPFWVCERLNGKVRFCGKRKKIISVWVRSRTSRMTNKFSEAAILRARQISYGL